MLQAEAPQEQVSRFVPTVDSDLLGKAELAKKLGWSRPKLDRRLQSDPRFPVMYRGGQGQGREWKFDWEAVQDYLKGRTESETGMAAMPESGSAMNPTIEKKALNVDPDVTTLPPAEHYGEATARSRRDIAQAQLLEDKLRKDRGQLVEVEDLKNSLSTTIISLGKGLDTLPDAIVTKLALAPGHALTIREMINRLRTGLVTDLQKLLNDPDAY